jgi:hypothetical protein
MKRLIYLLFVSSCMGQTAVPRPSTPSATTLASPTSQIAAWYRYAVWLESKPTPSLQSISDKIDLLANRPRIDISVQNSKVVLKATATGIEPIEFTWIKDGVAIGTGSSISVQGGTAATYQVVASNQDGNAKSETIVVTAP